MIRTFSLAAALAAGLALPAFANESTSANDTVAAPAARSAHAGNFFTEDQARQHLMHLGYTNVSGLAKDANGKWIGSAAKDGKTVGVAVDVKGGPLQN